MSDDKNKIKEKVEKKTEEKTAHVKDAKPARNASTSDAGGDDKKQAKLETKVSKDPTSEKKIEEKKVSGLEELPEEIKKKLEKRKTEKAGKTKKGKGKMKKKKKKEIKKVSIGKAFIKATYNNTIVTLTDLNGNVISWASAGIAGFKGPKKSTPYAASIITRIAVEKARDMGLQEVCVFVKGVGTGRESAVRALNANGLAVTTIKDITPIPHNGCRKRKPRRV